MRARVSDQADTSGFERAQENISSGISDSGGCQVDRQAELLRTLVPEGFSVALILKNSTPPNLCHPWTKHPKAVGLNSK